MVQLWLLIIGIFIVITVILHKLSFESIRNQSTSKTWHLWGNKTMYWRGLTVVSGILTALFTGLLLWSGLMPI